MFDFLVMSVNKTIDYHGDHLTLGLLDVYGFRSSAQRLEQFMINFLNEKLQHFIELTLRTEQEEYEAEGIAGNTASTSTTLSYASSSRLRCTRSGGTSGAPSFDAVCV